MKLFCALAGSAALILAAAPAFAQQAGAVTMPAAPSPQAPLAVQSAPDGQERTPATPEMKAARQAMRASCAADMASLCADVAAPPPGEHGGRMQCLRTHAAQLSVPCRQALVAMRDARKAAES